MTIGTCPKCGFYGFLAKHTCPPQWLVYGVEYASEKDAITIYARDGEKAAEIWMEEEETNSAEYYDEGEEIEVMVKPLFGGEWEKYLVHAEMSRDYYAEKVS